MQKPSDWDTTEAWTGDNEKLEPGGHICIIKAAREEKSQSGRSMLTIAFDIAPNEPHAGMFKKMFDASKQKYPDNTKWPNGGVYRQLTTNKDGTCNNFFKGMITSIEESNANFHFDFDERKLAGKLFGGVFQRQQYEAMDGSLKWSVKCIAIRSVKTIKENKEIPEDKYLDGMNELASNATKAGVPTHETDNNDFVEIDGDEELPF